MPQYRLSDKKDEQAKWGLFKAFMGASDGATTTAERMMDERLWGFIEATANSVWRIDTLPAVRAGNS